MSQKDRAGVILQQAKTFHHHESFLKKKKVLADAPLGHSCFGVRGLDCNWTHWLRKAKRYLMTMMTVRGRVTTICWMWWALSAADSSSGERWTEEGGEGETTDRTEQRSDGWSKADAAVGKFRGRPCVLIPRPSVASYFVLYKLIGLMIPLILSKLVNKAQQKYANVILNKLVQ